MNTPLIHRLTAAVASVAITFALLSGVFSMAQPTAADALLAQATTAAPLVR